MMSIVDEAIAVTGSCRIGVLEHKARLLRGEKPDVVLFPPAVVPLADNLLCCLMAYGLWCAAHYWPQHLDVFPANPKGPADPVIGSAPGVQWTGAAPVTRQDRVWVAYHCMLNIPFPRDTLPGFECWETMVMSLCGTDDRMCLALACAERWSPNRHWPHYELPNAP